MRLTFGKYKGQPVEQLRHDPAYTQWLMCQPWFSERYSDVRTLIVNNFSDTAETPEHNEMQSRFLRREYAFSAFCACGRFAPFDEWYRSEIQEPNRQSAEFEEFESSGIEFEVDGWDVSMYFDVRLMRQRNSVLSTIKISEVVCSWGGAVSCELKPTLGEDYPGVLRQVKSRKSDSLKCVLVDNFVAQSVDIVAVKTVFALSRIRLILTDEIVLSSCPDRFLEKLKNHPT